MDDTLSISRNENGLNKNSAGGKWNNKHHLIIWFPKELVDIEHEKTSYLAFLFFLTLRLFHPIAFVDDTGNGLFDTMACSYGSFSLFFPILVSLLYFLACVLWFYHWGFLHVRLCIDLGSWYLFCDFIDLFRICLSRKCSTFLIHHP